MGDNEIIRSNLDKILMYYGAIPPKGRGNWTCLSSRHKNPRDNLSVKGDICCCHCGLKGDSFSVIAEMESLDFRNKDDFLLIVKKASEILNMPVENKQVFNRHERQLQNKFIEDISNELTRIISEKFEKSKTINYIYFYNRGISNIIIFKRYKFIVANPKRIFPTKLLPNLSNIWAYEFIIPVWRNNKVVNCILRRNDFKSKSNNKILNLKGLPTEFFNIDYLEEKELKYLFICEGIFDALTFENLGYKAISINSIVMIHKLFSQVKNNKNGLKNTIFFIAFDQDEKGWGQKASKELLKMLRSIDVKCYSLKIQEHKDINEYYCTNQKEFLKSIDKVIPI